MADVKWVKIPSNFFELDPIKEIEKLPNKDEILIILIQLIFITNKKHPRNSFQVCKGLELNSNVMSSILNVELETWEKSHEVLTTLGLMEISNDTLYVKDFWKSSRDRGSKEYINWRAKVFQRDKFTCQCCHKVGGELEAHHKIRWVDAVSKRYEVDNGITLCKKCHKKVHGKGGE